MAAPLSRLGILGDIHCEDVRLAAAIEALVAEGVDDILSVGDILDGPGDAERTVTLLLEHGITAIRGNHERWFLTDEMRKDPDSTLELGATARRWLEDLPPTRELETVAGKLLLCHGVGSDDMAVLRPDTRGYGLQAALMPLGAVEDVKVIVGGHTHERMVRALGADLVFINPGTLHRRWPAGFGLLDLDARRVRFWDFEGPRTKDDGRAAGSTPLRGKEIEL